MQSGNYWQSARTILLELGISPHHLGFKMLNTAIPLYAKNNTQSATKELYPELAKQFGYESHCNKASVVERPIRYSISESWNKRNPAIWERYFKEEKKAPSNMVFISVLAEYIKQEKPLP